MAKHELPTYQVTERRLDWKRRHLGPTDYQAELLEYVKRRKAPIPFDEAIGINWTMLGGLLSRGILVWADGPSGLALVVNPKRK